MNCPNCKSKLSCGCQQRIAPDGTKVCSNCIAAYTKKINSQSPPSPTPASAIAPSITNIKLAK